MIIILHWNQNKIIQSLNIYLLNEASIISLLLFNDFTSCVPRASSSGVSLMIFSERISRLMMYLHHQISCNSSQKFGKYAICHNLSIYSVCSTWEITEFWEFPCQNHTIQTFYKKMFFFEILPIRQAICHWYTS